MRFLKKLAPFAVIIAAAAILLYLPDIGPERYTDLAGYFKTELHRQAYRGYVVAVVEDGSVLYVDAFGKDGKGSALSVDTPLLLGSVSKTFTGLASLSLVREKLLSVDTPVIDYLPWFSIGAGGPAAGGTPITLRHLLSHTTGVSDRSFDDVHAFEPDLESAVRHLALARPEEAPGLRERYLDTDYQAAALVLEKATGLSFSDMVSLRIFRPLGMTRSSTQADKIKAALPIGSGCFFGASIPRAEVVPPFGAPSGYIVSTAIDMSRYLAYLAGPEKLPRTPVTARDLHLLFEPLVPTSRYSWGWRIEGTGKELAAVHAGSLTGFSSSISLWPGKKAGLVILAPQNSLLLSMVAMPALTEGARHIIMQGQADKPFPLVRLYMLLGIMAAVHLLVLTFQTGRALGWARDARCRAEASGSNGPIRFAAAQTITGILARIALIALAPYLLGQVFGREVSWSTAFSLEPGLAAWFMAVTVLGSLRNAARLAWLRGRG